VLGAEEKEEGEGEVEGRIERMELPSFNEVRLRNAPPSTKHFAIPSDSYSIRSRRGRKGDDENNGNALGMAVMMEIRYGSNEGGINRLGALC